MPFVWKMSITYYMFWHQESQSFVHFKPKSRPGVSRYGNFEVLYNEMTNVGAFKITNWHFCVIKLGSGMHETRSPAVAGMDRPFLWRWLDRLRNWRNSKLKFRKILVVTDVMDGQRCSTHYHYWQIVESPKWKTLRTLDVEISHSSWSLRTAAADNWVSAIGLPKKIACSNVPLLLLSYASFLWT